MPYDPYPQSTPGQQVVQGLQAFSDSVKQLAMQHSLQEAQSQIDEATTSSKNEFEMHQAYARTGQQLAFQMAGVGADASHIQTILKSIPGTPAAPQNALEGLASENKNIRDKTQEYLNQQHAQEIAKIQATGEYKTAIAATNMAAKKEKEAATAKALDEKTFNANVAGFEKPKNVATLLEGRDAIESAQQQLAQSKDDPAAFVAAAIGALRGTGLNRITELELKKMGDSLGLVKKFANMSANAIGTVGDNDIAAVQKVLDVMQSSNSQQLKTKAQRYAATVGSAPGSKHTPQEYYTQLHTKHLGADSPMPAFDSAGRFAQNAPEAAPAAATNAPSSMPPGTGAFGIPGAVLKQ